MKKASKRFLAFCLQVLIILTCFSGLAPVTTFAAIETFNPSAYNLTWNTPSLVDEDSMPTGNGEIGLNMWMENTSDLVFYISKVGAYANDMSTMKLGRIRVGFPAGTFTNANFSQTLDLSTGSIKIVSGTGANQVNLELWIDANAPVIHLKGTSGSTIPVSVKYELTWRTLTTLASAPTGDSAMQDVLLDDGATAIKWYHKNNASQWKARAAEVSVNSTGSLALDPIENLTFGGAISAAGMTRATASSLSGNTQNIDIKIDIHSEQTSSPQNFLNALNQKKQTSDGVTYNTAYTNHVNWWKSYWDTSYIEIKDGTFKKPSNYTLQPGETLAHAVTRGYLLQRYLQAAAMRADELVLFNGSNFTFTPSITPGNLPSVATNPDVRQYAGTPFMGQNTRAPYWATLLSGDFEQTRTLIDYFHKNSSILRESTKKQHGIDGIYLSEPMYPGAMARDPYATISPHLQHHFTATVEIPLIMVRYYNFTNDTAAFSQKILPFAEGCLDFMNAFYNKDDASGEMIVYPANSLETGVMATNSASIVGPMTALLDELLSLPSGSLSAAQAKKFVAMRNRMPDVPLRELEGVVYLAQDEGYHGGVFQTSESPQLYPVWPSNMYNVGKTEGRDIARQTFITRTDNWDLFGDTTISQSVGGWNQSAIFAAKLGLPGEAADLITMAALDSIDDFDGTYAYGVANDVYPNGSYPTRFPAFWGPYYDWIPDQCHGGNVMTALQTMVMQYDQDSNIYLLPSWPEDWDVNFRLHGPKNTVVTGTYKNGSLEYTTNNGYGKVVDLSGLKERVLNRVSVACADQNSKVAQYARVPAKVGPMQDGKYDAGNLAKYPVTQGWLSQYGHTLNGTVGTALGWNGWGGVTVDESAKKVYFHLKDFGGSLTIPNLLPDLIGAPVCLTNASGNVQVAQTISNITITMDSQYADPVDTIISMDYESAPAQTGNINWVNNDDAGVVYTGAWTDQAALNGEYQEDVHTGGANGDTISYTFTGTGVEILATKGPGYGDLEIGVDGANTQTVSLNAASTQVQRTVYALHGLKNGSHTVTITSQGGGSVNFDALIVYDSNSEMINVVYAAAGSHRTMPNYKGDERLDFVGAWSYVPNRTTYGEYQDDITEVNSNATAGEAYATYEFYGVGVEVIMTKRSTPADLRFEFSMDGGTPQVVSLVSGGPVVQGGQTVFSQIFTFPAMHTLKIRKVDTSVTGWPGLDAIRVTKFAGDVSAQPVKSIVGLPNIDVTYGTAYGALTLPAQVEVVLESNSKIPMDVTWAQGDYNGDSSGAYTLVGTLVLPNGYSNPLDLKPTVRVNVDLNPVQPSSPLFMKYNDTDPAVAYMGAGTWHYITKPAADYYNADEHTTNVVGNYYEITFIGTGIGVSTYRANNNCMAEIYLDEGGGGGYVLKATLDLFSASNLNKDHPPFYEIRGLDTRTYKLKVVKVSGGASTAGSTWLGLDSFRVFDEINGTSVITSSAIAGRVACKIGELPDPAGLPSEVEVTLEDGATIMLPVTWNLGSLDNTEAGLKTMKGTLNIPAGVNIENTSNIMPRIEVMVSASGSLYPWEMILSLNQTTGKVGNAFSGIISIAGGTGPYAYSISGLPAGLSATGNSIAGTPSVSGSFNVDVTVKDNAGKLAYESFTLSIAPTSVASPTTVNIAAVGGVTAPAAGAAPVTSVTETAQYTGTVVWNPNDNPFKVSTTYTATITLTPKVGYTLAGVGANFFTVAGATSVRNTANSGVITAVFPATTNVVPTAINLAAVGGVTAPVAGAAPVTSVTETAQYTGTVVWNPNDNPFKVSTTYTATITLTPKAGYTLAGVGANFFTVAGATSVGNAANSGIITVVFPATGSVVPTAYTLTVVNGVDNTNAGPYMAGTVVSIAANAAPSGQVFDCWVTNNGGVFANAGSANTTFTMPANSVTVTATYKYAGGGAGSTRPASNWNPERAIELNERDRKAGAAPNGDPTPQTQQDPAPTGTAAGNDIKVRENANTRSNVVGKLQKGDEITVLGYENGFIKIAWDNDNGYAYVSVDYVNVLFNAAGTIVGKNINVRSTAGTRGEVVGELQDGHEITILGYEKGFIKIAWDNEDGYAYVSAKYVSISFSPPLQMKIKNRVYAQSRMNTAKKYRTGTLEEGDDVEVLGRYRKWWIIRKNGDTMYTSDSKDIWLQAR